MIESDDSSDFTICADSDQTMRSKQSSMALRFQDNKGAAQMVNSVQDQTTKIETKNSKITKQNASPDDIQPIDELEEEKYDMEKSAKKAKQVHALTKWL